MNRPIPESYWVEPDQLLAGEYPAHFNLDLTRHRIDKLIEAGFDTFIDLTRLNETIPYEHILQEEARLYGIEVEHHRSPIGDFGLPTHEQMKSILDKIESSLQAGRKVYLHCWGGIGRTGTTVGCYLVRRGRTGEEALSQLAEWWRTVPKSHMHHRSPETHEQAEFVRNWSKYENNAQTP